MKLPEEFSNIGGDLAADGSIIYAENDAGIALAVQGIQKQQEGICFDGFRSLVILENTQAPHDYSFTFNLPDGCKLIEDGGYINIIDEDNIITDENGENAEPEKLGIIEPAWAEDANGKSVNTHYGIDGNTLTQIVEFDEENTFPVVADPEVTVNAVGEKSETSEGKEVVIDVPLPTETDSAESIIKEYAAVAIKCYGKARGKQYM